MGGMATPGVSIQFWLAWCISLTVTSGLAGLFVMLARNPQLAVPGEPVEPATKAKIRRIFLVMAFAMALVPYQNQYIDDGFYPGILVYVFLLADVVLYLTIGPLRGKRKAQILCWILASVVSLLFAEIECMVGYGHGMGYDPKHLIYMLFVIAFIAYLVAGLKLRKISKWALCWIVLPCTVALAVQMDERRRESNAGDCTATLSSDGQYRVASCTISTDDGIHDNIVNRVYATKNNALLLKITSSPLDNMGSPIPPYFDNAGRKIFMNCPGNCSFSLPPAWANRLNTWLF